MADHANRRSFPLFPGLAFSLQRRQATRFFFFFLSSPRRNDPPIISRRQSVISSGIVARSDEEASVTSAHHRDVIHPRCFPSLPKLFHVTLTFIDRSAPKTSLLLLSATTRLYHSTSLELRWLGDFTALGQRLVFLFLLFDESTD